MNLLDTYLDKKQVYAMLMHTEDLDGKVIGLYFDQLSTRTRLSFEIAAKKNGATVVDFSGDASSMLKGETWYDTLQTLDSLGIDCLVARTDKPLNYIGKMSVINAGNEEHHPTQAISDLSLMLRYRIKSVAFCGDSKYSRVVNSLVPLLNEFDIVYRFVGPKELVRGTGNMYPTEIPDCLYGLRLQTERHTVPAMWYPTIEMKNLGKDMYVMHPGPVTRHMDISDEVLHSKYSLVQEQVKCGVDIRARIMSYLTSPS